MTCGEGYELWPETDVILGIGSRMELLWFRWGPRRDGLKVATIDIDPRQPTLPRSRRWASRATPRPRRGC